MDGAISFQLKVVKYIIVSQRLSNRFAVLLPHLLPCHLSTEILRLSTTIFLLSSFWGLILSAGYDLNQIYIIDIGSLISIEGFTLKSN
jgi:hypothetical protein